MPELHTRHNPNGGRPRFLRQRVSYSVSLEQEQVDAIRGLSSKLGVSQSELTREALGLLIAAKGQG